MSERCNLREITQSAEFYVRSAALAMSVSKATDAAEVTAVLHDVVSLLDADGAAFASFIKDDESYASYRFILACDATWCLEYENGACYLHDPWLEYARHSAEPVLAERIAARTDRQRAVVALAHRFGFASAVIVPAQAPQGLTRLGALCLGSAQADYFDAETLPAVAHMATSLAMRLHEWQTAQLRQELLDLAHLSEEDLELLRHERQGHRSKHIAIALNMTAMSIDSRWQRLNAKLGVSSRTAAANLAAEYGIV